MDDIPEAKRQIVSTDSRPRISIMWVVALSVAAIATLSWSRYVTGERLSTAPTTPSMPAAPPQAQPVAQPAPQEEAEPTQVLGHFAYAEAPVGDLQAIGTFNDRTEYLRPTAAAQYREMIAAAAADGVQLVIISAFRSVETQEFLFFQLAQSQAMRPQERALVSAPPGFSEHHTGYVVDLGDGAATHTHLDVSFAETNAFRWLQTNAARFGFELSFAENNAQGVSYEPWHWRFVGDRHSLETFYGVTSSQAAMP